MDVIYTLIPAMIIFGPILVLVLYWAVRRGMYDDMEGEAHRILMDEEADLRKPKAGEKEKVGGRNWPDAD